MPPLAINQEGPKSNPPGMCHSPLNMPLPTDVPPPHWTCYSPLTCQPNWCASPLMCHHPPPTTDAVVHGGCGAAKYLGLWGQISSSQVFLIDKTKENQSRFQTSAKNYAQHQVQPEVGEGEGVQPPQPIWQGWELKIHKKNHLWFLCVVFFGWRTALPDVLHWQHCIHFLFGLGDNCCTKKNHKLFHLVFRTAAFCVGVFGDKYRVSHFPQIQAETFTQTKPVPEWNWERNTHAVQIFLVLPSTEQKICSI